MKKLSFVLAACLSIACSVTFAKTNHFQEHPYYIHALEDLRAARWMINHRPGNWVQTAEEKSAVRQIDAAINAIKTASIWDGKNIDDHPSMDEMSDHMGRLHKAQDFLAKARQDVSHEEDNKFARGLRNRAIGNIENATHFVAAAIHS